MTNQTPWMYVLHNLQGHFGTHFLILQQNSLKDEAALISDGIEFQITGPRYLNEFFPFSSVFTDGIRNFPNSSKSNKSLKLPAD